MRPKIALTALVAVTIVSAPTMVVGYPIPPVALWELVESSDIIVLAEVVDVREIPREGAWSPSHRAKLRPTAFWKGRAVAAEMLNVEFHGFLECPSPPNYRQGWTVLAFLVDEDGVLETNSLSYGTRYIPESDRSRVRELVVAADVIQRRARIDSADYDRNI
ncbi:hypothetical protein ABI59_10545 [Acidobacteria bacterium Mor1]|nr:hypothetical protein ABI59_10545 [Acidobacteria bacterium Mor1]